MKSSITDAVVIRSRDKDSKSASTSNFRVSFGRPLCGVYTMVYCLIPASAYPVNSGNNVIYFREDGQDKTATITPGNYTGSSLAAAVTEALIAASQDYATYVCTFSTLTGKLYVASTQSFVLQWGSYATNSAARVLGFSAVDTAAGTSTEGDGLINLAQPISLNIRLSPGSPVGSFVTSSLAPSGLVVPINTDWSVYSSISASEFPQLIEFASPVKAIEVSVTDSEGNLIDMNGVDWECYLRKLGTHPEIAH